jgi:hypothetical protein
MLFLVPVSADIEKEAAPEVKETKPEVTVSNQNVI